MYKGKLDECKILVCFDYSYNMLSSNALEGQVDELVLYVFDESGMLVDKHSRQGEAIRNTLVIEVDRPTVAGIYRFVAWGKGNVIAGDDAKFEIPDLTVGVSGIEELNYYLKRIQVSAGMN